MNATPEQSLAVATRGVSVVLASGAGCGKTSVLTQRYLAHLTADGVGVPQLAAITFTDKAARQMRQRIRDAMLRNQRRATSPAERETWKRHLRDLETAAISTIHSFCGQLVRQHALALGLDPGFEVLEEVLAFNVRTDALRDSLHDLLAGTGPLADDLGELVAVYGWGPVVRSVERLVAEADVPAWQAWLDRHPDDIAADWHARFGHAAAHEHVQHLRRFHPPVSRCLELLRRTPCTGPKMVANVEALYAALDNFGDASTLDDALKAVVDAAKVANTEKAKAWPDDDTYALVQDRLAKLRDAMKKRLEPYLAAAARTPADMAAAVTVGRQFLRVALHAAEGYRVAKRRAGRLDFGDLLAFARDLLRDHPLARVQLQSRYRFLLVDELQDTDPVQMELVRTLCDGPAGWGGGKLFAVGDTQQSIYRFRGAEMALFEQLREGVPDPGRQRLTVNFRSQPEIIRFANALLADHLPGHEPLTAGVPQVTAGPCVEFLWTDLPTGTSADAARRKEADRIGRRLREMIDRRETVTRHARPVQAKDVVLLFRSMSNVATYEAGLRAHGLDYYLVGGRAFFAQQEVYDLLMLLRALDNPADGLSLAGALRSPFGGLSDEALFWLARHPEGLWAGLQSEERQAGLGLERNDATRAAKLFAAWRAEKDRLPIADLLNKAFAECGYDAALQFEFLGDRKLANLWKLVDHARTFDRSGLYGLAGFIERLGQLVEEQPKEEQAATLPEAADVIRLMTIHQAKGLEFPVVVLPDLNASQGGGREASAVWHRDLGCVARAPTEARAKLFDDVGWQLRDVAEGVAEVGDDLRTLYVAVTRPEDHLILSASRIDGKAEQSTAFVCLADRFDLDTGRCRVPKIPAGDMPAVRVVPPADAADPPGPPDRARTAAMLTREDVTRAGPLPFAASAELPWRELLPYAAAGADLFAAPPKRERPPAETAITVVLASWDFADESGWRDLLTAYLATVANAAQMRRAKKAAEPLLAWFAGTELRATLATADEVVRAVPALLPATGGRPALIGAVDLMWRTGDAWRAALFAWDAAAGRLVASAARAAGVDAIIVDWPEQTVGPVEPAGDDAWHAAWERWQQARTAPKEA